MVNDFTKYELKYLYEGISAITEPGLMDLELIPKMFSLQEKLQSLIDNYCEHKESKMDCDGGISMVCISCGKTTMDVM